MSSRIEPIVERAMNRLSLRNEGGSSAFKISDHFGRQNTAGCRKSNSPPLNINAPPFISSSSSPAGRPRTASPIVSDQYLSFNSGHLTDPNPVPSSDGLSAMIAILRPVRPEKV